MYGMVTIHTENYFPLSKITWDNNKVPYAKKHGYETFYWDKQGYAKTIGYSKIHLISMILNERPDIEWLWWTGTDSLITNTEIKIEHKIHDQYHFIISVDFNDINCDSFLVRNTSEGRKIIEQILEGEEEYSKHWTAEQRALSELFGLSDYFVTKYDGTYPAKTNEKYKDIIYVANQTYMNSYDYSLYHDGHPQSRTKKDVLGFNGEWRRGDWLIHLPGLSFDKKVKMCEKYISHVI